MPSAESAVSLWDLGKIARALFSRALRAGGALQPSGEKLPSGHMGPVHKHAFFVAWEPSLPTAEIDVALVAHGRTPVARCRPLSDAFPSGLGPGPPV